MSWFLLNKIRLKNHINQTIIRQGILISQFLSPENIKTLDDLKKIYKILSLDPTVKNLPDNYEKFENLATVEWKGEKRVNWKNIKNFNGDFIKWLWENYDYVLKFQDAKERILYINKNTELKKRFLSGSIEDQKAIFNPQGEEKEELGKRKKEQEVEVIEKEGDYVLVKANSPEAIKAIANKSFNIWCVNSMSYARSYYSSSQKYGGFYYLLYKNNPIYAIGGSDGISNVMNRSLSKEKKVPIYYKEFELLKKWKDKYKYELIEEQNILSEEDFQKIKENIKDKINNNLKLNTNEIDIMLTYLNKEVDKLKTIDNFIEHPYYIRRGDGGIITKSELLVFLAKSIVGGPYEKMKDLPENKLKKIQEIISREYNASLDYLVSVVKYYNKGKYGIYSEGLLKDLKEYMKKKVWMKM